MLQEQSGERKKDKMVYITPKRLDFFYLNLLWKNMGRKEALKEGKNLPIMCSSNNMGRKINLKKAGGKCYEKRSRTISERETTNIKKPEKENV